ncbi:MAG: TetR/AcrR family transcriptional regulator [Gemmatimonadales bacterium]
MTSPATTNEPRWRRRPSERPTEILEAALDAFAERGLAGTRVDDIAARAGVSKGTLYLYFDSKEELFREAIRDKVARTLEGLASAVEGASPTERLSRFIEAYWAHLRRPHFASMYRLIMAELHQFPELTRFYAEEVSGKVIDFLAQLVRSGVDAGDFRELDARVTSRMIVSLLVQHAVWISRRELFPHLDDRTDEMLVAEIEEFIWSALLAPGAARPAGHLPTAHLEGTS